MVIGSFGDIVFETSRFKVRTFDDYKRSAPARWATHEVINKKQVLEFLGPNTESISFTMYFNATLGVNPSEELKRLREMRDLGKSLPLIIADAPVGANTWAIKNLEESVSKFDSWGNILSATVSISLEEYVPPSPPEGAK